MNFSYQAVSKSVHRKWSWNIHIATVTAAFYSAVKHTKYEHYFCYILTIVPPLLNSTTRASEVIYYQMRKINQRG